MTDLHGKTAIVTGAGSGIGRGVALRLGKLGATVIVNDLDAAQAEATASAIAQAGGTALPAAGDMSSVADIDRLFSNALDHSGAIHIVVANAGVHGNKPVSQVTEADYDRVFSVNAKGNYFTLQRAARNIIDGGRIIFMGSSTSRFPLPGHGLYGASKVSCLFLVQVLAKELGPRRVTVNAVLPTVTEGAGAHGEQLSPGAEEFVRSFNPMGRAGTVEDAADACEYLVSDLAGFVSGQHLLLSGGGPA